MASKEINIRKIRPQNKVIIYQREKQTYQEIKQIINRLYLQTIRKPTTIFISIIQPLLWLIMFGALFQNAPISLFENYDIKYRDFLNPGIIIFTSFNSSVNAGLTIVFDREFGFLNKILISPINKKNSIIYSCIIHAWIIAITQVIGIVTMTYYKNNIKECASIHLVNLLISLIVISTIIILVSNTSIYSAFILPGHIEFIALTSLFLNLPTLFTSTALAPLSFMPKWLQIICYINPLTYGIETIRNISLNKYFSLDQAIIETSYIPINGYNALAILITLNIVSFILVKNIIKYKYDKN